MTAVTRPEAQRLASLLPGMLLVADAEHPDRPLQRLLDVLAVPLTELAEAVRQLERDPFVSRASAEALPLIAELVGARLLGDDAPTNRRVVARTVGWRRRKGTLATLEEVLTLTSAWPAEVDEGFRSLLVTQDVTAPLPARGWTALLWDPIALTDPLTRRARHHPRHPSAALDAPRTGDDVEGALRRIGAPDALALAASPRTVDLDGWARPDGVAVRTSRVAVAERDQVVLAPAIEVAHRDGDAVLRGLRLDPGGGDGPIAARVVAEPAPPDVGLTAVHEDPRLPPVPRRPELLTPTDLAADALAVADGDALLLTVDGVTLVGQAPPAGTRGSLVYGPPGAAPTLRFADASRPGPGETWRLDVAGVDDVTAIDGTLTAPEPPAGVQDTDAVVLTATVSGAAADLTVTPAAVPRAGAVVALRLERTRGSRATFRRDDDGAWSTRAVTRHDGDPVSGCVVVPVGGDDRVARLVRVAVDDGPDDLALAVIAQAQDTWTLHRLDLDPLAVEDRPGTAWLDPGPAALLVPSGADVLLVAPDPDGAEQRAWRLRLDGDDVAVDVLDAAAGRRPAPVEAAAGCVVGDVLTVHGGQRAGSPQDEVWQLHLAGPLAGRWVLRRVRDPIARSGGALLATPDGLVRVGGADGRPGLCPGVHRLDLDAQRPRWEPLADLPLALAPATDAAATDPLGAAVGDRDLGPGEVGVPAPGTLVARADGDGLDVMAWSDRTRPRRLRLAAPDGAWQEGPPEPGAPNPPAEGESLFVGDALLVMGPSPLPASEVVVTVDGRGHLAFLPALDPRGRDPEILLLDADGGTRRWFAAGVEARPRLRLGRSRETGPARGRPAPDRPRVGAAGRLRWTPLVLRQASLGPWDRPLALRLADAVALDPRLGRVVLDAALAGLRPPGTPVRFAASYHVARGAALGAGFAPPGGVLPDRWTEPAGDDPDRWVLPVPPEQAAPPRSAVPVATVGPPGWLTVDGRPVETALDTVLDTVAADGDGGSAAGGAPTAVVAVVGSPRLGPVVAAVREAAVTSIAAWDPGGYPYVAAGDDGVSLALQERVRPGSSPDVGPRLFLSGLALGGALELALTSGEVDLRWCDLGLATRAVGVRVAGAGHHTDLLRATPAEPTLVLRLHGCRVARLEIPPWVRVVAAGCTFDAGDRGEVAVTAPGAWLRLRECTVRGRVVAGALEASSCVFAGALRCDRPDLGWLRRCLTPTAADRRPRSWRGIDLDVSFADGRPTWPRYLVLDDNNPEQALVAGERGMPPGAHADRGRSRRELAERTDDFLPLGLAAHHSDRAASDVQRMGRRLA